MQLARIFTGIEIHPAAKIGSNFFIKNQTKEEINIEVFDLMGRLLASQISQNENIEISASNWKNGFYTIHISNRERKRFFIKKLIK